jgi:hypothetical protein
MRAIAPVDYIIYKSHAIIPAAGYFRRAAARISRLLISR